MIKVFHHPVCPFSRKLRILLKEKGWDFSLISYEFWKHEKVLIKMNPAGETPILLLDDKKPLCGNFAITEYIEEISPTIQTASLNPEQRAEIRRITEWFDTKFYNEVTTYILFEKIIKTLTRSGAPNSQALQAAKKNILNHLEYIGFLTKKQRYLAGEEPCIADFAAAAQLSVLDFVSDVPWQHNSKAKEWYSLIKSRPSFKPILTDRVINLSPSNHYANPDF